MKTIVVYKSSTGFTKKYAEWVTDSLNCKAVTLKEALKMKDSLVQYDNVIFGGWVMGGMIMGLNKVIELGIDKLTIFAVGGTEDSDDLRKAIVENNKIKDFSFFYYEGGLQYDKVKLPFRLMLKAVKKDEYGKSFDHCDKSRIESLVNAVGCYSR